MTSTNWEIDHVHSNIDFTVRHLVVSKVRGRFPRWSGKLVFDDEKPEAASIEARIDAASIDTGVADRDAHLRSADFLEVEKHPHLEFKSTRVTRDGDALRVAGDLTIRGVTRPATLDVEIGGRVTDPWGNDRVGFSARTSIDRKDWGLTWNKALDTGGVVVGDRIDIAIDIEATRAAGQKAA